MTEEDQIIRYRPPDIVLAGDSDYVEAIHWDKENIQSLFEWKLRF